VRRQSAAGQADAAAKHQSELDLVVPFTTPDLTRAALAAAARMSAGLNARVRLLRVHIVPAPLDIVQSPIEINFLKEQLSALMPDIPASRELRFARDWSAGLLTTITGESLVVLAAPRRLWKTKNERLAAALARTGYRVVLIRTPLLFPSTVITEVPNA